MSISIRKLNKVYPNGNHALKDVCLEIPTGMFGLLGPNGAGKSTLMRILVALMEPTSGEVNICGYDLMRQRKEIRGVLGYLPQDFRFFAKYKTYEFLDYAARLSGMNCKSLRKNAVDEKVIIVDEPTTGLDPEERIRFRNLLSEVSENDVTIILSTHIVGDISSTCNCMALMNKGEVSFYGSPQDMLRQAEGKVWRIRVTSDELHEVDKLYPVISTIPSGTGWEVQVVADEVQGYDAESYPPNLEHAYVYYMENKLNRWRND